MTLVFVDADVLAQATPRTILYLASAFDYPAFGLIYSRHVEREAERAQRSGARRVSELRDRFLWDVGPDHPDPDELQFVDTDGKDRPVLAAALVNNARIIVTDNVRDFGSADLAHIEMSVVHPGLFLAARLNEGIYRQIIETLASARTEPPNTALAIHRENVSDELPDLFAKFQDVFGPAESRRIKGPLRQVYRGVVCIRCGAQAENADLRAIGVCERCLVPG